MEYYSAVKIMNVAICSYMGGHYAKRNKQDRERQTLYNITYMWNLKKYSMLIN